MSKTEPLRTVEIGDFAVPRHVAIIMDGNGRWAAARGLPRGEGHRRGVEACEFQAQIFPMLFVLVVGRGFRIAEIEVGADAGAQRRIKIEFIATGIDATLTSKIASC